jgi:hypothetical protein
MLISQAKKVSRTIYQLHKNNRIAFTGLQFGATSLFSMLLAIIIMDANYKDYWDTTIYRTQTVDFNILANLLPTKLSIQLSQNDKKGIQETLDSNFGLFGIVVTDCKLDQKECPEQKILFASRAKVESISDGKQRLISEREYKGGWISLLNEAQSPAQQLKKEELYLLLRNIPPLIQERKFQSTQDTNVPELKILNKGNIIGRVYLIRKPKPSFSNLLSGWVSSEKKYIPSYYQAILFTSISSGLIVFILSSWLFEWQRKAEAAERKLEDTQKELQNTRQELSITQSNVQILKQNLQDAQNKAAQNKHDSEKIRQALSEIQQREQQLIQQLRVAETNPETTSQELENTRQSLSETQQREQQLTQQLRESKYNTDEAEKELQRISDELSAANRQVQSLKKDLIDKELEVEKLDANLKANTESWKNCQPNLNENNISDSQETKNTSSEDRPQFRTVFDALKSLRDEFSILEIGSDALKYAKDLNDHHAAKVYEQLSKLAKFGYEYFQVRRTILGNDILLELNNRGIESSDESKRILDKIKKNKGSSLQMRRFSTLNGKSKQMTYHIKIGGNEVRIYFYFCTETNKVLIGYCGKHL